MPALSCFGSEVKATGNVPSSSDHQGEQSALPPFSGELNVDEELKLSHENFKQTIGDFFKDKQITPLSQLTETPAFPTPHVLAQFASKTYTNYKRRETDAQYEKRLALPDGWKLLTSVSNITKANGYFGAAYWHPEHQQVVIAHRGTNPTNLGALWTDLQGVMRNHYVRQMESASTFAHKVVEVLREVRSIKGVSFQLFFTGHSLGGWLAQITTFTTKYLKTEGNIFLKSDTDPHSYHPHTVVFDSPGCKDMLSQMTDKLDVRLDGRSIDIEHLDVTSYLTAPNRINTCNLHVGTVYRIFPDLSGMDWLGKHTALYTIQVHGMDNIVQVFDPERGQVNKDEQGSLKINIVIDWPNTAGFRRCKEYRRFFKWANQFNNYHPDITDETSRLKGCHPMRYQTKTNDARLNKLSVFCQQERQFLESYRLLRQLPAFFKPKELFCLIKDKQAQEQAEKLFQEFEIENDTIRCSNANELQALIPYVKRLLEMFPQLVENTKGVLTSQRIGNNVYQFVTKRYVKTLHQSPLDIKSDDSNLRDFLNSEEQKVLQLRMVDGDAWTGLIKVYQVLEKTPSMKDRLTEGHYTILTLEHLILVNHLVNLKTLLQSTTAPHLLMMSCDTNQLLNVETKQIVKSLFSPLRQKQSVKIILTTQSEGDIVTFLQDIAKETLSDGFVARDEQLTWGDLTPSSQETLLQKRVKFQGASISLNELMSAESPAANFLPVGALLEEKELTIADPVFITSGYNENFYIDRTLCLQKFIKEDIFSDKISKEFPDLIASTEQEFKQFCQQNPNSNIHWLEKDKSRKIIWQQSQGSLETLRRYVDTEISRTYTADDLDKLLEQAQRQRVILISDTAGMGKSILLTQLSKQIKQKFPTKWVVRIDINDHTDALHTLQQKHIDKEKAIEFVSENLLKFHHGVGLALFKECCERKQKVRIILMLDGFDEISPNYKGTVIDLLQAVRQTAVEQLWVTTRPHLREELEDKLQQLSYTLEPFSVENQVEFLKKFWCQKDWFAEVGKGAEEEFTTKLENYAEELIGKLSQSISDRDKQFTGIPLQCHMLAEAFDKEVKTLHHPSEFVPELPFKLDLPELYERFIERKYEICLEEKGKISTTNVCAKEVRKERVNNIVKGHQLLALKVFFTEEQVALLHINSQCTSFNENLTRTGIVQISNEGKLHFIHRTFAEFYVADYFVKELTKGSNISQQLQDLLLRIIFLHEEYRVIRAFIDGMLSRSVPSNEVIKQCGNRIHDSGEYDILTLYPTVCEGNTNILGFLLDCVQEHRDTVVHLLIAQKYVGHTAWHVAAEKGQLEVLQKLCEWAKKVLSPEDLHKMFLGKDGDERTAWHMASEKGQIEVLQKLWEWAKEVLTQEESKNMFLTKDRYGRTSWHMASEKGQIDVLHKMWVWAKEVLTQEEFKNMFSAEDGYGRTAWHLASEKDHLDVLYKLWEWAKEVLTKEEFKNMLFLAKNGYGRSVWHLASEEGQLDVLYEMWELAKEVLTQEEFNNMLFLAKDVFERTAWHLASENGQIEVLHKLREWAKGVLTQKEFKNMFLAKDQYGRTAWHMASDRGQIDILHKLWEWAKEVLTQEEFKYMLFSDKDAYGKTAWHIAAHMCQVEILHKLWEWAKEVLGTEELNEIFWSIDDGERTACYVVAKNSKLDILHKFLEWDNR